MRLPAPSTPFTAVYVALAGALGFVALVRGLFDPDYFWHLATGRLVLDNGAVPTVDRFSFTWAGRPWVPDQWLAEVVLAVGDATVGPGLLLAGFAALAAAGPVLVARAADDLGARRLVGVAAVAIVAAAMLPQVTARPQVLSFAFMGVLLAILMRSRAGSARGLWVLPPLFLIWANTHGFFIVGLGVGFVFLVATVLGRTPMAGRRILVVGVGLASLVATFVTPSGPQGLLYALSFADVGDFGAAAIMEWQSPNFHNEQFAPFLAVLGMLLLAGVRRAPAWMIVVALVGAGLGLFAARSIGIGSIMVMPAVLAASAVASGRPTADPADRARRVMELATAGLVAVLLLVVAVASGPVDVDRRRVPVPATAILRELMPDARVLASYEWGGYVLNELHDVGGTVFVDGRMHKYAPDVLADYVAIVAAEQGWEELVDAYRVDAILLDVQARLTKGEAQAAGWCEAYRDDVQVLLFRSCPPGDSAIR